MFKVILRVMAILLGMAAVFGLIVFITWSATGYPLTLLCVAGGMLLTMIVWCIYHELWG